ncbi:E3 ubiquitin-protein ligase RGLG1 isoform X2 [Sorghum bicolor]|uniref:E3 ubiquitin-protein ligase RGLG1 isoform X2 n=1 Tax=Sorghum bicolor TaxID=4558 RepID=UPI000B425D5C|nr:E3 ubiquitin-protein ligase RGLG1 isoform X2 [Sorghum bicolor]|eukprot:XP_021302210.1 E3 ubiquitin-protein ligase RGLG1 isoform X2 [Sorghum bicolor]
MSGFLAVVGKIGTFLLWVLFLVLQTATRIVGSLLASPAEQQEDHQQESAVGRRRSPPASPRRELYEPASAPPAQLWDPPPLPYLAFAPAADENPSSSFRRRASAPLPRADEDVVVSSSAYSRPTVAVAHTNSVSATPLRTIETRAMPSRLATAGGKRPRLERKYSKILDQYRSLDEVIEALAQAGLESSNLIIGIDFTKSNEWTGKKSFNGMSLHNISDNPNPYEQAITIIGKTLSAFDEDNLIPCFGFGDASTHDQDVFAFYPDERPCNGFQEALARYREIVPHLRLSGPTSFAPIIEMATTIVEQSGGQYHVLVIIADGQVTRSVDTEFGQLSTQEQMTVDAIVQARRRIGESPERISLPPPFASYSTVSRAESSWANSYRSVPSHPREEPTVDSTNTASVTSPSAAESRVLEPQMCPVCLSKPRDMAFGCGHQTCSECGPQVADCPICRRPIDTRVKLY